VRLDAGRQAQPSLGICDSQSVKLGKKGRADLLKKGK